MLAIWLLHGFASTWTWDKRPCQGGDLIRTGCDDEGDDIECHAEARGWVQAVVEDYQRQLGQCWRPEVSHPEEEELLRSV